MKHLFYAFLAAVILWSCESRSEGTNDIIRQTVEQVSTDSLYSYVKDLVAFGTRHSMSSQTSEDHGIGAAVRYIEAKAGKWAAEAGREDISVEVLRFKASGEANRFDREINAPDVLVTIPGTVGSSEILLMAHIDTRVADLADSTSFAPGADDDGSGVACLLETVRLLSKVQLKQTVKCLFVSCEEQNLGGSEYAAKLAKEEGWPLIAVISNDMIGNTLASGTDNEVKDIVRVFSESKSGEDSDHRQLARYIKESGEFYVPGHKVELMYRNDRYRRGGDHSSFLAEGFTSVRVCEYCENYDRTHQYVRDSYGDVIEAMDFEYLTKNTKVNIASVMNLAQAPAKPENAVIANANELSNVTVLSWSPVEDAAFYEILIRATNESNWACAFSCDNVCDTLPYSKDNYFFAVRSVSDHGNPSLPAVCR